ncbi:MAG: YggS family pyridoxal phosphate-dependent enzyme [Desulfobacteraceae bacterium]|nr:YggS family pyridoxal phosphate-dependent enzyme [Desulfobacteraceae bacterium]
MSIEKNLEEIKNNIKNACIKSGRNDFPKLIAVSKTKPYTSVLEAAESGQYDFGENYIQEAMEKIDTINRKDITWHFIGGLQSNKAKFAVKYFDLIHSVDSIKLAKEINRRAKDIDKIQDILIQINTGKEEQKSGIMPEDAEKIFEELINLKNIRILGLMAIPPFGMEEDEAEKHFSLLQNTLQNLNSKFENLEMTELSMGMSDDFHIAIKFGATMVRVGTKIFGERNYK